MARAGVELEIKLTGAPETVAALPAGRVLKKAVNGGAANGDGSWARLVSTYYDAPDGALEKAGVALRLREKAGARVQTVKRAAAGRFERAEEETALAPGAAFPAPVRDPDLAALIEPLRGALHPVARTVTDRWTCIVERDGARIEVAVDLGRAEGWRDGAPVAAAPVAEAEFELLDGEGDALFAFARRFLKEAEKDGAGPWRLSVESKAERARRLARPFAPIGPDPELVLDARGTAADAFAAALIHAARRILECAPAVLDHRAPEGVHQMRVALRRLRAVERLFRKAVAGNETRDLARRARDLAKALGPARDWDVFLEETFAPLYAGRADDAGFGALKARAEALRAQAWAEAVEAVAARAFSLFALDLMEAGWARPWARDGKNGALDAPVADFAANALEARLEAARAVAPDVEKASPEDRHRLRIELKKLRYAAQTFRSLYPRKARKPYLAALSKLQDAFGALNDAAVAQRLAGEAAIGQGKDAARAAGFVTGYRAREAEVKAGEAGARWRAFLELEPFWRDEK
ncbi:MAG: CYTH and CHAD domain-containing protein [Amphiplicatus sp.]